MNNYSVTPEVGTLMSACEALFGRMVMSGKLTPLDREIVQYYAEELQKRLQGPCETQKPALDDDTSEDLESPMSPSLRPSFFDHF